MHIKIVIHLNIFSFPIYNFIPIVMDIVDRLKLFMQYTGLSSSQFADSSAIPRPTLSQIITGRNKKISNEIFAKLHEAFPQLNIMWLMFGDGNMLSADYEKIGNDNETVIKSELAGSKAMDEEQTHLQQHLEFGSNIDNPQTSFSVNLHKSGSLPSDNTVNPDRCKQNQKQGPSPAVILNQIATKKANSDTFRNHDTYNTDKATITATQDTSKRISSIMVFYSDNSFETFTPA